MSFNVPRNVWEDDSGEEHEIRDDISVSSVQFIKESKRFSFQEDIEILQYIKNNCLFDRLKGVLPWKSMAETFGKNRTFESLKGRFRTSILAKIDVYCKFLKFPQEVIDQFHKIKVEMYPKHLLTPKKCDRRAYSPDDDRIIIDYVFNVQKPFSKRMTLSGNLYWRIACYNLNETHNLNRTWQSIKQHFKKSLVPVLAAQPMLYSSKHQTIARQCYIAFDKNNVEENMKIFEAKCLENRSNLGISDSDEQSSDSDDDSDTVADIIKNYHAKAACNDMKSEKSDFSSDESIAPSNVAKETKKRKRPESQKKKKDTKKIKRSKKLRRKAKLAVHTENGIDETLPNESPSQLTDSFFHNNHVCDTQPILNSIENYCSNDSSECEAISHPEAQSISRAELEPTQSPECETQSEFQSEPSPGCDSLPDFETQTDYESSTESQKKVESIKNYNLFTNNQVEMSLFSMQSPEERIFIKKDYCELPDLNCEIQEKVLIFRILQPSVRSRVFVKNKRRYVI